MDPMEAIEAAHGFASLGALAVQIYRGALEEAGGDEKIAHAATAAAVAGLVAGTRPDDAS